MDTELTLHLLSIIQSTLTCELFWTDGLFQINDIAMENKAK